MSRIVIALGGNALGKTYIEQQKLLNKVSEDLIPLIRKGHDIVITHGNGPQVGMINLAFENNNNPIPLDICTAMSQGYIGYHIQNQIKKRLEAENIEKEVVSLITEVIVDEKDQAFNNPTKPIGKFYSKEETIELLRNGEIYKEDAGRGYRKVVSSPIPIKIKEYKSVINLLNNNTIVITCGGGGIPVFEKNINVSAVIDKDLTSSLLAQKINADYFIILTAVSKIELKYGTENAIKIGEITVDELKKHIENNEFAEGSMLPKIKAAIDFTNITGNPTIITSLSDLKNVLETDNKTMILKS